MSVTLIPDLASEVANTYVTQAYADQFWAQDYRTARAAQWAALSSTQKASVLVRACKVIEGVRFTIPSTLPQYALHYDRRTQRVIDMQLGRDPVKFFYYQRLQFPRNLDVYYQNPPVGAKLGDLYIPEDIMLAQCEQAGYLIGFDDSQLSSRMQGVSLETVSLGKGQVASTTEYSGVSGSSLAPAAVEYLKPYAVGGGKLQRA